MLDPQRLRVFHSVVTTGSMSAAATRLGYSPSAVSQQVAALEREAGVPLLDRVGRGVRPTAAGLMLADRSAGLLDELSGLAAAVADLRQGRTGQLVMTAFDSAGVGWMPDVVAALSEEFPDTRVRVRLDDTALHRGERPDLAVVVRSLFPDPVPGYTTIPVITEPYVAVVPAGHPLDGRDGVTLTELVEHTWIDNDISHGPCRGHLIDACHLASVSPTFSVETTDYPSAMAFVARGIGLTVCARLGARFLPAGTSTVAIVGDVVPRRSVDVCVKDSTATLPVVQRALELLVEVARA